MVHSYNTVFLRHIYSVLIQNTFSKIHVLYMCKSSLCDVKFRVKSIYIGFFKFPFSMDLVYTFKKKRYVYDDKLEASCELSTFIETLISRACWRGEDTKLGRSAQQGYAQI